MDPEAWIAANNLIAQYSLLYDAGQLDEIRALFTQDATMESLPLKTRSDQYPFPAVGRAAIHAALSARADHWAVDYKRTHLTSNVRLEDDGDGGVNARCHLLVLHQPHGGTPIPTLIGEYRDHIVRDTDGEWRFERRVVVRNTETKQLKAMFDEAEPVG
jgi:hypothetical protein